MGFRPQVAFAGTDTFKIEGFLAELAIQHLAWRIEAVQKLLGSVFSGEMTQFVFFYAEFAVSQGGHFDMLALLLGRSGSVCDHQYVTLHTNTHTVPTVLPQINEIKSRINRFVMFCVSQCILHCISVI